MRQGKARQCAAPTDSTTEKGSRKSMAGPGVLVSFATCSGYVLCARIGTQKSAALQPFVYVLYWSVYYDPILRDVTAGKM